jgi:hypothetical protein
MIKEIKLKTNCSNATPICKSKCFKIALLVVTGIAALGWVVMLLWNWLMPELFTGAQKIGYFQALGVFLLSKILFGGCHAHGRWKERRQRWESMTPEEREQLKGRFKSRWGQWCCPDKAEDKTTDGPISHGE